MLQQGQKELAIVLAQFRLIDEAMPVMLAYLDRELCYRYHNRAFRAWLGRDASEINGRPMREVLGEAVFAEIRPRLAQALAGSAVRYERTHKTGAGGVARVYIHLVPRIADTGRWRVYLRS